MPFSDCRCRCQKCKTELGWVGYLSKPPQCPKCGHVNTLSEPEEKIKEAKKKLLVKHLRHFDTEIDILSQTRNN